MAGHFSFSGFMEDLAKKQEKAKEISRRITERFEGYLEISLRPYALFQEKRSGNFFKGIPQGKSLPDFQRVGAEVSLVLLGQGEAYREIKELIGEDLRGPLGMVFETILEAAKIVLE